MTVCVGVQAKRTQVCWKRRMRCWPVEWEAGGLTCESGCARFAAVVFTLRLQPVFVALQALREAFISSFPTGRPRLVTSQIVISQSISKILLFDRAQDLLLSALRWARTAVHTKHCNSRDSDRYDTQRSERVRERRRDITKPAPSRSFKVGQTYHRKFGICSVGTCTQLMRARSVATTHYPQCNHVDETRCTTRRKRPCVR